MGNLGSHPLRRSRPPAYPTKLDILATPRLLERHQPRAWRTNRELAAAAGVFLAANATGCGKPPTGQPGALPAAPAAAVVAPIFEHGDGRGSTGCVVVSPPTYLSEEEALAVIRGELRARGIDLAQANAELAEVKIPQVPWYWEKDEDGEWQRVERPDRLVLVADGLDATKRIAVEFVSITDCCDLGAERTHGMVTTYDCKEGARLVADSVRGTRQPVYFAAFYDPVASWDSFMKWASKKIDPDDPRSWESEYEQLESACKEASDRLLREQVRDFVDWLKGHGVI